MTKPPCFVFDIDGTLADHEDVRSPFDESKVHLDKVIEPVAIMVRALIRTHYPIIFLSGRTEGCRVATRKWIIDNVFQGEEHYIALFMRREGDHRNDAIVKKEFYDNIILPTYTVMGVFDDRMRVCRMLYENGIFCFNVNQGLKEF